MKNKTETNQPSLVDNSDKLIEQLKAIAIRAGEAIMQIYQQDIEVMNKSDDSPLTQADLAAHNIICAALGDISEYPVLSEESAKTDWDIRATWEKYWLVDPLDGTKEFIKRNGEFTVNIALIDNNKTVLGVVYAPVLQVCYWGVRNVGAFKQVQDQVTSLQLTSPQGLSGLNIVGSRSHVSQEMSEFLKGFPEHDIIPKGSSLKLCMVAEGSADIYPRLGLTSEWDTAAGHAVVDAAGGIVCKTDGTPLLYNTKDSLLNPHFLVLSTALYEQMFSN